MQYSWGPMKLENYYFYHFKERTSSFISRGTTIVKGSLVASSWLFCSLLKVAVSFLVRTASKEETCSFSSLCSFNAAVLSGSETFSCAHICGTLSCATNFSVF